MIQAVARNRNGIQRSRLRCLERAILRAKDEPVLLALCEHVFGNAEGSEEFRASMKTGDWCVAMADRLCIDVWMWALESFTCH
jgi:hypothetical protein